jgi:hypothetical protein
MCIVGQATNFYASFISTDFIWLEHMFIYDFLDYCSELFVDLLPLCCLQRILNLESEFVPCMHEPWQFDKKKFADRLHEILPQNNGMKDRKVVSFSGPLLFDVHELILYIYVSPCQYVRSPILFYLPCPFVLYCLHSCFVCYCNVQLI